MSTILKIMITNYDEDGGADNEGPNGVKPLLKYKIGLVSAANQNISNYTEYTLNNRATGVPDTEITLDKINSDISAITEISSISPFDLGGVGITDIVIETTGRTGDNGISSDFQIYTGSGADYKTPFANFTFTGMQKDSNQSPNYQGRCQINNLNTTTTSVLSVTAASEASFDQQYLQAGSGFASNLTYYENNPLGDNFCIIYENGSDHDIILAFSNNNCFASWTPIPKIVPVSDLKVGDLVRTNVGDQKISKIMKSSYLNKKANYVVIEKNCFGNNLPSEDIYLTKAHPLSIGYFNVKDINNNVEDPEQDEKVFVHVSSSFLVNKIPGIYLKEVKDNANYNLIFDKHCSIDIGGLDVVMHHAVGNTVFPNPKLTDEQFQNPETATKKGDKPFYMSYENLLKYKPENMELKTFLGKCFVYDIEKKFNFGKIDSNDNIFKHLFKY